MKKLLSIIIAMSMLMLSMPALAEQVTMRNGITFGMSKDEIIEIEGDPDENDENLLGYYAQKSAGHDCSVGYSFTDNKLDVIYIIFSEKHSYENTYIEDFNAVDKSLISKYGEPQIADFYSWKNSLYKDDPEEYGFAISCGHLSIYSSWELDGIKIWHVVYGDNFKISHCIKYSMPNTVAVPNTDGI